MKYELIISVLAGLSVIAVGASILLGRWARRAPLQARLRSVRSGGSTAGASSAAEANSPRMTDLLGNLGSAVSSGRASITLKQQLIQAGYHHDGAAATYLGAKVLFLVIGVLGSAALFLTFGAGDSKTIAIAVVGTAVLFFLPNMTVSARRASRRGQISRHLPDAIDLLEICASAGMGLDMAWNSVTDEVRGVSHMLADEMALTNLEIHLGASRADAMRHMASRTGADELSSLVAVLVQSERFGTSITEALRTFAMSMRESRSQRAQEAAEKMAVKLIFPMIIFIFPAVVMVMAGPACMMLYKALSH